MNCPLCGKENFNEGGCTHNIREVIVRFERLKKQNEEKLMVIRKLIAEMKKWKKTIRKIWELANDINWIDIAKVGVV
jgi:hypothetical protein